MSIEDFIASIETSRSFFLKHLQGISGEQWDWKPYPECKSIRETIQHLISDDAAFLQLMRTGEHPDYESVQVAETDAEKLLTMLHNSHAEILALLREKFASTPLDTEILSFFGMEKLPIAITSISSEDYYHAGQVAYIRLATTPDWNYYAEIYGM